MGNGERLVANAVVRGIMTGTLSGTGTGLSDSAYRLSLSAAGGCTAGAASGGSCREGANLR